MTRRKKSITRTITPDPVYHSTLISMFIARILLHGKKSIAQKIMYSTLEIIQTRTQEDALTVLEKALRAVTPIVEVKSITWCRFNQIASMYCRSKYIIYYA